MSFGSEHDRRADDEMCSGFIDEGRRRDGSRSDGQARIFICMGIIREEWDIQRGRKQPYF